MRLLILGGGGFLGYHIADQALQRGHQVTVLSRTGEPPLDGVEVVSGDRRGDLDGLSGRLWDAAVDTYTDDEPGAPAIRRTAELLTGSVGTYCYVSGMSVYAPDGPPVPDERAPVRAAGREPDDDPLQARSVAKLAGEAVVEEIFGAAALLPRVGIMVGPRDPSHRFTWWPMRFYRALTGAVDPVVLGPGNPDRTVQYSDARDVAGWIVDMAAAGRGGIFNTVGPGRPDTLGQVLRDCQTAAHQLLSDRGQAVVQHTVEVRWQPDEHHLRDVLKEITEEDRPLWYPEDQIPQIAIDSTGALEQGLRFRPGLDTAAETLEWALEHDPQPLASFREPEPTGRA